MTITTERYIADTGIIFPLLANSGKNLLGIIQLHGGEAAAIQRVLQGREMLAAP